MSPDASLEQQGPPQAGIAATSLHSPRSYALAAALTGAALLLCLLLRPVLSPNYFTVFLCAVALAAWYGGRGPGLACAALSGAASAYLFLAPVGGPAMAAGADLVRLGAFMAAAWLVSTLSQRLHVARADAEARAEEAGLLASQLQEQAAELELQAEELQSLNAELEEQFEEATRLRDRLESTNRQLRDALRETAEARDRLSAVIDTVAAGVLEIDTEGRIALANPAAEHFLRLSHGGADGYRYDDLRLRRFGLDGEPLPPDRHPVTRVLREGKPLQGIVYAVVHEDGTRAVVRVNAAPLRGEDGSTAGVVVSFEDVTEEHRVLDALRESEARFRSMADSSPVMVWMAGPDAQLGFFNRPRLEFTGRTPEQEAGYGWAEGVHADDRERCMEVYLTSFRTRSPFCMDYRLRRADGEYRWVMDSGVPLLTPDGAFAGFIGSCVDVHDRRMEEERERFLLNAGTVLGSSLEHERTLAELARHIVPDLADACAVYVVTSEGEIRRMECAPGEAAPLGTWTLHPHRADEETGVPEAIRTLRPVLVPEVSPADLRRIDRDGERITLLDPREPRSYLSVPLVARGRVIGALSLATAGSGRRYGPSDLHLAEEVARRAAVAVDNACLYAAAVEASQAKSDFMAVMSHELRTPLNAIIGYIDLFLLGVPVPLPDPLHPQAERIRTAARHLLRLIEEILTFARIEAGREEVRLEPTDAAELTQEAAALVEPLALERGLDFRVEAPARLPVLVTDAGKARQVLVNLLANAVKFTERGEVVLRVEETAGAVAFGVHDTGPGIAPEQHERVFEPFWQVDQSISRRAGGTGLGLSVARQLARLLGGDVTLRSAPGAGSTFVLHLPTAPPRDPGATP